MSLTLKDGEIIKKMKVQEIDSVKINGIVISRDALTHEFVNTPRTILVADIEVLIKKR